MRKRGIEVPTPTDPMNDPALVRLVARVYDIGGPANIPADAIDEVAA
ncbi:MAG: hypothetical protein R3E53_04100 [Myxococcota bacterium]